MVNLNFACTRFLTSAAALAQAPPDAGAEVAFAGRSNAGKSSVLNALTGQRLARVSKTPGRTQLLNFFALSEAARLVDLPGYGFARVPLAVKARWGALIEDYFAARRSLRGLVVVMDARHPLTELDAAVLRFAAGRALACRVLLNKADTLGHAQRLATAARVEAALAGHTGVRVQLFSAKRGDGVETLREQVATWLGQEKRPRTQGE